VPCTYYIGHTFSLPVLSEKGEWTFPRVPNPINDVSFNFKTFYYYLILMTVLARHSEGIISFFAPMEKTPHGNTSWCFVLQGLQGVLYFGRRFFLGGGPSPVLIPAPAMVNQTSDDLVAAGVLLGLSGH